MGYLRTFRNLGNQEIQKYRNTLKSGNTRKLGNIRISGKSGNTYEISHLVDFWSCFDRVYFFNKSNVYPKSQI